MVMPSGWVGSEVMEGEDIFQPSLSPRGMDHYKMYTSTQTAHTSLGVCVCAVNKIKGAQEAKPSQRASTGKQLPFLLKLSTKPRAATLLLCYHTTKPIPEKPVKGNQTKSRLRLGIMVT